MRQLVNLRELRERAALSQGELARMAGVSKNSVGQLERGEFNPRPVTVRRLAEALGVHPTELWEESALSGKAEAPSANPPSSAVIEAGQQSVEAATPPAEDPPQQSSQDVRIQNFMERPSFWAAKEKIEGWRFGSDAVEAYIEQRTKAYEDELEDPNSPHFRTATAAALWAETLHREAYMLAKLGLEEVRPYIKDIRRMSSEEKGWAVVEALKHIAKRGSAFEDLRMQADKRVAAMHDQPDILAQKRLEKARQQAEEGERQLEELQEQLAA